MKFMLFAVVVLVACVGLGSTSPAKDPPKKSECANVCTDDYTPVCGAPSPADGGAKVTFGNKCVMEKYNCESKKSFTVSSTGECEGKAAVRLQ